MEKKINNYIKKIEVTENPLKILNEMIEEVCVNSSVLLICDYLTIKKYQNELDELKQKSLNNIVIKVVNSYCNESDILENFQNEFNETFSLIVGVGGTYVLKLAENLAIKTNSCYAYVNLFLLKSEIFSGKNAIFCEKTKKYMPYFILINDFKYSKKDLYYGKINIFKYFYLFLEYNVNLNKNVKLKEFLESYKEILSNLNDDNIINSLISLGLILNKYDISFFNKNLNYNEFFLFMQSVYLNFIYLNLFNKITSNNLYFSRTYKNSIQKINNFNNFDFDFYEFYVISIKQKVNKIGKNLKLCLCNFCDVLKNDSFELFYNNIKHINTNKIFEEIKNNKDELFLGFLENFEIFNF